MACRWKPLPAALLLLLLAVCISSTFSRCCCSVQTVRIMPGFRGSEMNWINNDGLFLLSNSSAFGFGFVTYTITNTTSFLLAVVHRTTSRTVWSANRDSPVTHSDEFVFDKDGNAYLQSGERGGAIVWSTNTSSSGATALVLRDSGNLVLLGHDAATPLWQSFDHPTDTLLSGQIFAENMSLVSNRSAHNLTYSVAISSGDMNLFAGFATPQPYWSLRQDRRVVNNKVGAPLHSAALDANSWNFYDGNQSLLRQLIIISSSDPEQRNNATLAAVLGSDGLISFYNLQDNAPKSPVTVPEEPCSTPEPCDPYYICSAGGGAQCRCPAVLNSDSNCNPDILSPCSKTSRSDVFSLAKVEDSVGYFATSFVQPFAAQTNISRCQDACADNCSCLALFFDNDSGRCFLFNQIGSLRQLPGNSTRFVSYIKISASADGVGNGGGNGKSSSVIIIVIALATAAVIAALIYATFRIQKTRRKRKRRSSGGPVEEDGSSAGEDPFLEGIAVMPVRFSYRELQEATDNFSVKLGQGGFGSVYLGKLPDGSRVAVKKLEGIGQGKKEFRAEVSIIGSIHHVHLVRLRGFCAEGTHRLLAYEFMAKGSLDRWIFPSRNEQAGSQPLLDWDKRFNIALGTAKGLAYLHEDCDSKIVHCDIKPENILVDDNFVAKVSDFGLAKLMTREQSHVFTTLRGTRGYLAPEWITNYAISEKSDVYSFGMVLLEIIGGRKNFNPNENSERSHFPSYAFKKLEEGKLREICDAKLSYDQSDERVERAIKVALWCIQEDMTLRPPMTKVVQMLEGLMDIPQPPTTSQLGFGLYANVFKSSSEEGTSSGLSYCNTDTFLSAVRLSGPR